MTNVLTPSLLNPFDLNDFFSDDIGICVKDLKKTVLHQNATSIAACGDLSGKTCQRGCMKDHRVDQIEKPELLEGLRPLGPSTHTALQYDVLVIQNQKNILTILYPLSEKIEKWVDVARARGLSEREVEVLTHVLAGETNQIIGKKLFISMATIKTHLRNIYRRLPAELVYELKRRDPFNGKSLDTQKSFRQP